MHPAFSVIFLTTLIGAGQGLFLALYTIESYGAINLVSNYPATFFMWGGVIALLLLAVGLFASFFHLGHPERAWRSATQWRTSWLSREVILLPVVMGLIALYALLHYLKGYLAWDLTSVGVHFDPTLLIGGIASVAVFTLFIATGMIYASMRLIPEWASPLTVVNFLLLGASSGFILATAYATPYAPDLLPFLASWATLLTVTALLTRMASLFRNCALSRQPTTLQTAIGVRHTNIQQKAMGMMGGSFNTREYFHHRSPLTLKVVKWTFLLLLFPIPLLLLWSGVLSQEPNITLAAFGTHYLGLLFERWFFFAQANHVQNVYYQTV